MSLFPDLHQKRGVHASDSIVVARPLHIVETLHEYPLANENSMYRFT
jgi:hypothetical protein